MTNEFLEKILEVLVNIHYALKPPPFWQDYSFWSVVVGFGSVVILAVTLRYLVRYTKATEMLAEYQVMPAIDVRMIYNQTAKKTYFWFSNDSKLPGLIDVKYKRNNNKIENALSELRIPSNEKGIKTADSFFWNACGGDEVTLYVLIKPAFKKLGRKDLDIKTEFEKSYRFNGERNTWDDTSWGHPVDRPFPFPSKTKKCIECKSVIDFEAKKCRYCLSVLSD